MTNRPKWPRLAIVGALILGACDSTSPARLPDVPAPLAATPTSDHAVTVTWGLAGGDVAEVEVERAGPEGAFVHAATLTGPATTFTDLGLVPATPYRYRVRACNEAGCSAFSEPVTASTYGTLALAPVASVAAVLGDSIARIALVATGGTAPISFSVASGALPTGISLDARGVISGTPGATGVFPVVVRAASGDGQSATLSFSLTVRARLAIETTALPPAVRGAAYSAGLAATGADTVYTWYVDAGSLPAGLSLSNLGIVSGTPTTEQVARFTARVRSGDGQTAVREFAIEVAAPVTGPALSIRTALLPPALAGAPYGPLLSTVGGNGSQVTWTVVGGALPPGLSLSTGGAFGGATVATGSYAVTVRASDATGQADQRSFTLRVVPDDRSRFDVTRVDVAAVPAAIEPHVQAAIARWERTIRGDLAADDIPRGFFSSTFCGGFGDVPNGTAVDDVIVMVNIASIDGAGRILGQAAPCAIRDNALTVVGTLTLDADDLGPLVGTPTLTDIIFHEIGHILGFGTLWEVSGFDYVSGAGTADPRFSGPAAVREWQALGGTGTVPLENMGGAGTADAHWRETTFRTEVMTGYVSPVGTPNPLSRVTIGSMADLGYGVDYTAADAYARPSGAGLLAPAAGELGWDVADPNPILMLLPDGTARPIPR